MNTPNKLSLMFWEAAQRLLKKSPKTKKDKKTIRILKQKANEYAKRL